MAMTTLSFTEWISPLAKSAKKSLQKNRPKIETSMMYIGSLFALTVMIGASILFYIFQEPFTVFSRWGTG